jgi:hypothetical protein
MVPGSSRFQAGGDMKQLRVAAIFFLLVVAASSFASVVVGDDQPVFVLGQGSIINGQSVAQPFTLSSDAIVNQVHLSFLSLLLSHTSGAYPFTIHIANGLAVGSADVLTLNESVALPTTIGQITVSYGFAPITLAAGNYYLILTSSFALPPLEWEQNQAGSSTVGTLGSAYIDNGPEFGPGWQVFPPYCPQNNTGLCTTSGTMAFDLDFVLNTVPIPPVGGALGQGVRLTVVAGPAVVPPGVPVEANLGFVDLNGNAVGPSSQVALNPGQAQSLQWIAPVQEFGQRVEVRPVVTQISTDPSSPTLQASVEVFDLLTGFSTVLAPAPAAESVSALPRFLPQGLAGGQTMRLNVVAFPPDPCIGQLSFADKNGAALGPSLPVNLAPGTATSLDLNADGLGLTLDQHTEVQPVVSVAPSISSGPPIATACQASVEVFDHLTGRTWTYQRQLPAVQLPAVQ